MYSGNGGWQGRNPKEKISKSKVQMEEKQRIKVVRIEVNDNKFWCFFTEKFFKMMMMMIDTHTHTQ